MKISVFITSYNQRECLIEAIESVLAQSLPATQIIVVDDASIDGSADLISDYTRRYPELFTPIFHRKNTGVSQVRVDALNAVRCDYVTYLDGDDWFLPEKLELESAELMSNPEARIAFSNNEYVAEDGETLLRLWVNGESVPQGDVLWQTFARAFPRRSLFRMELVHYDSWRKIGFHDTKMRIYEDFDMRIRLTNKLKVVYVDRPLSRIRTHQKGLSKLDHDIHFRALNYIFKKNLPFLNSLPIDQRSKAVAGFAEWVIPIALRAAKTSWQKRKLLSSLKIKFELLKYQKICESYLQKKI